jgi:hypothetical protein
LIAAPFTGANVSILNLSFYNFHLGLALYFWLSARIRWAPIFRPLS